MNDTPPTDDPGDGVEELYRKSSAQSSSRPSAKARQAILKHAARLAANHSHTTGIGQSIQSGTSLGVSRIPPVTRSSGPKWWRPVLVGSLAAAALAGLWVGPQFLRPSAPPVALLSSPTATNSASKLTKSTEPSESVVAETNESAPMPMNLPADVAAPHLQARAMHVAPSAPAAAPANTDQALSEASDSAAIGGGPAASTEGGAGPTVTGMRVRQMPSAPRAGAAAAAPDATAPVDARDSDGRTALMVAVLQGRLDTVVALLRRGADPNAADRAGVTPLQAARARDQPEIADALLRAGAR